MELTLMIIAIWAILIGIGGLGYFAEEKWEDYKDYLKNGGTMGMTMVL